MTVVVFRSRLDAEHLEEFGPLAARMLELAEGMPGFLSYKAFGAEDGERVSIIEFGTPEQAAAWGAQAEHREAQALGRERFDTDFSLQICDVMRSSRFAR